MLLWFAHPRLPRSERKLIRWRGPDRPDNDPSPVIIPCLCFRSSQTPTEHMRILLEALNDQCPAVSQRVFKKVKTIHARWVQTVAYPDQWNSIALFLYLFNHLRPGDAPKEWDTLDLRQLDIAELSPITFAALDGCFNDEPDDDFGHDEDGGLLQWLFS
ncbi:uncharacterized protein LOC129600311 [Paramacrobiotus metropolitanus]|uniref:uncharacterized protein LOC129600311 n=1 Tax=Paramacrobiotus metropolitanus TaxID=2943436 RepID=UPI002445C97C|nr:uncharacterized protein LOC129600311 [Paramacrobiotus metropolitanus]